MKRFFCVRDGKQYFDRSAFMVACGALTPAGAVVIVEGSMPRLLRAVHFLDWFLGEHALRSAKVAQGAVSAQIALPKTESAGGQCTIPF